MKNVDIILGTLFGDESKGSKVNYRCSKLDNPMVVRFNGGHQVGHTVVVDGYRHVFSNFGSGTLQDAPTFWSKYCTVDPVGVLKEGNKLREDGYDPQIYYDAKAMVTTPFDMIRNRNLNNRNAHGSVGVGFGQTIQRNEDHYHLYMRDLLYPEIRDAKLNNIIKQYYNSPFDPHHLQHRTTSELYKNFIEACDDLIERYDIVNGLKGFYDYDFVFEGAQGIMLDMDYGFFPNVTRSNCTSKNAIEIIKTIPFEVNITTYYMTRAYQCRHGNGHMTNETLSNTYIKDNPNETNVINYQGEFRKTVLDLSMLRYAVECDRYENPNSDRRMVVSCLDQVPEDIPVTIENGELTSCTWEHIGHYCGIYKSFGSWSEEGVKDN